MTENEATLSSTGTRRIARLRGGAWSETEDCLVSEEPLEIRVDDRRFTVTMRTPGEDFDLARGLLFAEGVIASAADVAGMRFCDAGSQGNDGEEEEDAPNVMTVRLRNAPVSERMWQRNLISGTSCGLCGKAAIEAVHCAVSPISGEATVDTDLLLSLPNALRQRQTLFERTGGLHAAALFDGWGKCLAVAEDIGRHNATDKVIGRGLAEEWLPWSSDHGALILLVSGRASFEIVQKAAVARIPILCSVSAASTLAVDLAAANGQTLIGFLRGNGMTVYTGEGRIRSDNAA